jgi:hypothetical protein
MMSARDKMDTLRPDPGHGAMRNRIRDLILLPAFTLFSLQAIASEAISPRGRTVVSDALDGHTVAAEFVTHVVDIGRPNAKRRLLPVPGCTYSRFPCIFLDSLQIAVDGHPLVVPRSVSATLPDLRTAALRKGARHFELILEGGDASEGYRVVVEFDQSGIKSRRLYGSFDQDVVLEETTYRQQTAAGN